VVVEGRTAAREALGRLRREGATGAVLAARHDGTAPGALAAAGMLPAGADPLRPHVRPRRDAGGHGAGSGIGQVLDALVGAAVRVEGWERAIDLSLDRPDLVVVTGEGDRFAATGWRVRSGHSVVTAAAVEEAERRAATAAEAADVAAATLSARRRAHEEARRAAVGAARASDGQGAAMAALEADQRRNGADRAAVVADGRDAGDEHDAALARHGADVASVREVEEAIPGLEAAAALAVGRAGQAAEAWGWIEERRARLRARRQDLHVAEAGLVERRRVLEERLAEVERRLEGHAEERQAAAARRRRLQDGSRALVRLHDLVVAERERLEEVLASLRRDYRDQVDAVRAGGERLEVLRRDRSAAEARLGELTERSGRLQLELAEVGLRTDALSETVRRELQREPADVVGAPPPDLPAGVSAEEHAETLARRLETLGPVNPLALDELAELEERQRQLDAQIDDVRSARRELQAVIRALDEDIMKSFTAAAADVNEHFSSLVVTLFPGGTGRLVLTEPGDLLNTGVEVEVRPAGRNIRRVSLLSGGERSLAALAFLFAVFRSRPSPFYLMDEVEAALDDVNLTRFLALVREFGDGAQMIIVSHQKRTMETGDALYGVTMAPGGSSQVVSQRVARDEVPAGA
jgi:chromosome segregation protein